MYQLLQYLACAEMKWAGYNVTIWILYWITDFLLYLSDVYNCDAVQRIYKKSKIFVENNVESNVDCALCDPWRHRSAQFKTHSTLQCALKSSYMYGYFFFWNRLGMQWNMTLYTYKYKNKNSIKCWNPKKLSLFLVWV